MRAGPRVLCIVWLQQHGWFSVLALLPLVVAAWLNWVSVPALRGEVRQLDHAITRQAAQPPRVSPQAQEARQYTKFQKHLLGTEELPRVVQTMLNAAGQAQLQIDQADYRMIPWAEGDFRVYQISLPVHGAYADIRSFLNAFLVEEPGVALAEVNFKREGSQAREIDAKLKFYAFVRIGAQP